MIKLVQKYPDSPIIATNHKINNYVKHKNNKIIKKLTAQNDCRHIWQKYGHGFHCTICGFYTGSDEDFKKLINQK